MASTSRDKPSSRKRVKEDKELSEVHDITVHETSGFKFSRQSRYRKGKGSASKSARKKRRSSFVRGRKERKSLVSLPAVSSKSELYKDIPKDLPPVKRLTKLFDACLESALEKLDSDTSKYGVDEITNFNSEAKEVFNHLRSLVSESDIVCEALRPDERIATPAPNRRNEELEAKAASWLALSERLKVENEKWETLLSSHQDQAEKIERECKEDENLEVTDHCQEFLSNEQHQLLSGKPSLNSLMENLERLKQTAILQVDKVDQAVNTIKQYEEACWQYVNQQTCTFGKTTFEAIDEIGTPRAMIRSQLQKL